MVIKNGKRAFQRMNRPEVSMTFFIGCDDPMEEEAENIANSSVAPTPLQDEEMTLRRKATQALTLVIERSLGAIAS